MRQSTTHAILVLASIGLALAMSSRAPGQDRGPSSIIMAEEPVALAPVGLEVQIPDDASGFRNDRGDIPTLEISPMLGHWFMTIQAPQRQADTSRARVDGMQPVDDLTDRILENLLGSYRVDQTGTEAIESRATVLLREKGLTVAGRPASRFYVQFPEAVRKTAEGNPRPTKTEIERFRIYTLIDAGAGQMVSFDIMCDLEFRNEAKLAYLTVLESAQFSGNTEVAAARALAVETTEALLNTLTPAAYERAIEQVNGRWDRLSIPASTGTRMDDTERGYRHIRAWKGRRGEIDPDRREETWTEDDLREGYIVRMDGRMIERWSGGQWRLTDTRIICFMTPDRQHEAWTATTTFRQGELKPVVYTELGIRDGQDMTVARRGAISSTFQPAVPPRGYLSQAEFYLLPQLIVGNEAETTYGVYAYTSGDTNVRYRQFVLESSPGRAAWKLTSELGDEARSISLYDAEGEFLGSDRGDESRWTPSTQPDLLELWQRKGLPTRAP